MSQATQVKLLRVLDNSTFRHVGGTAEISVDVRVLAATNRDLSALVEQGLFREDLYYRVSTIIVRVPPLRERQGDIDLLAEHFVTTFNTRFSQRKRIGEAALALLRHHDWPGNVRELSHAVEHAMVVCPGDEIQPEHLPVALRDPSAHPGGVAAEGSLPSLAEMERVHIARVLQSVGGHRANAARILGISERNLYRKLKEFDIA